MNRLRIVVAVLVSLCVVMGFAAASFAHPARDVILDFDPALHFLTVEVDHSVSHTLKHYIDRIEVFLNDELIITQDIRQQLSQTSQKVSYIIVDAVSGDTLKVKTTCNMFGSKEGSIVIP